MELLAESFAEKPKEKKADDKGAKEKEAAAAAAAKKKANEKVELLDGKTLRNTGIAFKRFRCVRVCVPVCLCVCVYACVRACVLSRIKVLPLRCLIFPE